MSAASMVPSSILVELMTPVPLRTLVRVKVEMLAESKTTALAPLKLRVKEEELMIVLASRVRESANLVKSKVLFDISVATIVPSRILVELIQPVQLRALVRVKVEILAESKFTLPLKLKVNEELEITVLASRVRESLN